MSAHEARGAGIRICIDCMLLCMGKGGGRAGEGEGVLACGQERRADRSGASDGSRSGARGGVQGGMQSCAPLLSAKCVRSQSCWDMIQKWRWRKFGGLRE